MTDELRERMVAALYGELDDDELRALRARIAADPALRAEWDELNETRDWLRHAERPEREPEFVFLAPARPARRVWFAPAAGFALAAAALLVFLVAGLRVDRVDGGLAIRWGAAHPAAPSGLTGIPIEPATGRTVPEVRPAVADDRGYLTRAELVTYSQELVRAMGTDLTQYDRRRNDEILYMMHQIEVELARRQQQDYDRLEAQIIEIRRALATPASGETR